MLPRRHDQRALECLLDDGVELLQAAVQSTLHSKYALVANSRAATGLRWALGVRYILTLWPYPRQVAVERSLRTLLRVVVRTLIIQHFVSICAIH